MVLSAVAEEVVAADIVEVEVDRPYRGLGVYPFVPCVVLAYQRSLEDSPELPWVVDRPAVVELESVQLGEGEEQWPVRRRSQEPRSIPIP